MTFLENTLAPADMFAIARFADACQRRVHFCEDILVRLGVDGLVLAEDNAERDSFAWIAAATNRGIPTTVVSYGVLAPDEAEHAYAKAPSHQVAEPLLGALQRVIPHWLRSGDGYTISRLPPLEALGRYVAGFDYWNPWLVNAGSVGGIAVESARMRDSYLSQGFPPAKLHITGHPSMDIMHRKQSNFLEERQKLTRYGVSPDGPLIVVAMPPDQTSSRPIEFGSYQSILDAFTQPTRSVTDANIIVSPHFNVSEDHRAFLRSRGIPVAEVSASELLPLADLFVASVSSTIKWALACGIPTIDYDVYGYRYSLYDGVAQVQTASTYEQFLDALRRWMDPSQRASWRTEAVNGKDSWGTVDGRAMDRVIDLVLRD